MEIIVTYEQDSGMISETVQFAVSPFEAKQISQAGCGKGILFPIANFSAIVRNLRQIVLNGKDYLGRGCQFLGLETP